MEAVVQRDEGHWLTHLNGPGHYCFARYPVTGMSVSHNVRMSQGEPGTYCALDPMTKPPPKMNCIERRRPREYTTVSNEWHERTAITGSFAPGLVPAGTCTLILRPDRRGYS